MVYHRYRPLSPQELIIATYVDKNLSDKEIAEELHITVSTVQRHLDSIGTKLREQAIDPRLPRRRLIREYMAHLRFP